MRAERVGSETMLAQIVADGGRGAALARADPAPGRRGRRLVRAGGGRGRDPRLRRLVDLRPAARDGLRAGRRGLGADHRLPLRARPGDADVDHGRHRARRPGRRADQERRGARALRQGRHAGGRQDRHADRGQAQGDRRWCRPRASTRTSCCGSRRASSGRASIRSPRRSSPRPTERGLRAGRGERVRFDHRQGRARHGRRPRGRARQPAAAGEPWTSIPARWPSAPSSGAPRARP